MTLCKGWDTETPLTGWHYGHIVSGSPCTEVSWSFGVKVTVVFHSIVIEWPYICNLSSELLRSCVLRAYIVFIHAHIFVHAHVFPFVLCYECVDRSLLHIVFAFQAVVPLSCLITYVQYVRIGLWHHLVCVLYATSIVQTPQRLLHVQLPEVSSFH